MPAQSQLAHRVFREPAFPYISNNSPVSTDTYFATGSTDILTSIAGYAQRRPGFADTVETNPTTFANLQRLFTWDHYNPDGTSTFFVMACDITNTGQAAVFKMEVGVDLSFIQIFIEAGPTSTPYDFVVSNNTVYFSNGTYAKKWDPVNGVSNWGIAMSAGATSFYAGTAADVAPVNSMSSLLPAGHGANVSLGLSPWLNPNNITLQDGNAASCTFSGTSGSDSLQATQFGFNIPPGATVTGIYVQANVRSTSSGGDIADGSVKLIKAGVVSGTDHANGDPWLTPFAFENYGGPADLWGLALTPANVNASNFGVAIEASSGTLSGTAFVEFVQMTVFYTVPSTGTKAWTNPNNIIGAPDAAYATCLLTLAGPNTSDVLNATNYAFALPAQLIGGIQVNLTGHISTVPGSVQVQATLLQNGIQVGTPKSVSFTSAGDVTLSFGSSSDLWGTNWSSALINNPPATFGVALQASTAVFSETISLDSVQISVFLSSAPVITFTGTGLTATSGYQYVITYGNSNTGHVSSPSPPSNFVKPVNQNMTVTYVASTDPQVNQIHIYRTTDSATGLVVGGQSYFELPNSPVANSSSSITDGATDLQLNIFSVAPTPTFNDPPTPMHGSIYFSGRIWGFKANKVYFSGLEEITVGVPEESFPSGVGGNFWSFDQPVQSLGLAGTDDNQKILVKCGGRLYSITGNTLDTFRRKTVSQRRGNRNLTADSMIGGMNAWLDSANQIWASNGSDLQELSISIRPDLASINQSLCCMTFHTSSAFHWMVFSTGEKLIVYDIDLEQWMPPWTFRCKYLYSGEISPGNYVLMASTGTKAVQLNPSKFNDQGVLYAPAVKTNLMSVVPDFGKRFSYIGQGMYDEPSRTGVPFYVQVDTNFMDLEDVQFMVDDDPMTAVYTSIIGNQQEPMKTWNRKQGLNVLQNVFPLNQPSCRWFSLNIMFQKADRLDKLYGYFLAYKALGGK